MRSGDGAQSHLRLRGARGSHPHGVEAEALGCPAAPARRRRRRHRPTTGGGRGGRRAARARTLRHGDGTGTRPHSAPLAAQPGSRRGRRALRPRPRRAVVDEPGHTQRAAARAPRAGRPARHRRGAREQGPRRRAARRDSGGPPALAYQQSGLRGADGRDRRRAGASRRLGGRVGRRQPRRHQRRRRLRPLDPHARSRAEGCELLRRPLRPGAGQPAPAGCAVQHPRHRASRRGGGPAARRADQPAAAA